MKTFNTKEMYKGMV